MPGYGWAPVPKEAGSERSVQVDGDTLSNGVVTLKVSHRDGTFALDGVEGFGRVVDGGDIGDTYNWCPPDHDTLVEGPESVQAELREHGPLRATFAIDAMYRWPARADEAMSRRSGEELVSVQTRVSLSAGEPFVRVHHTIDNRADDPSTAARTLSIPDAVSKYAMSVDVPS